MHAVFEIQISTLLDCLNVFGTAGERISPNKTKKKKYRGWHKPDDPDSGSDSDEGGGGRGGHSGKPGGRIEQYLGTENVPLTNQESRKYGDSDSQVGTMKAQPRRVSLFLFSDEASSRMQKVRLLGPDSIREPSTKAQASLL